MRTLEKGGVAYAVWETKDGRVLRLVDMDDAHLVNTIRMLERKAHDDHAAACTHVSDPDDIVPEEEWMEHPALRVMRDVARSRGIML